MAYYGEIESPLLEALEMLCGQAPESIQNVLQGVVNTQALTEADHELVYEWATGSPRLHWATGLGVLDAADTLVHQAIENDNITGPRDVSDVDLNE